MRYTPAGRSIYAQGGNEKAAKAADVRNLRLTIGLFVFGGMMAAFAGVLRHARGAAVARAGDSDRLARYDLALVTRSASGSASSISSTSPFTPVRPLAVERQSACARPAPP